MHLFVRPFFYSPQQESANAASFELEMNITFRFQDGVYIEIIELIVAHESSIQCFNHKRITFQIETRFFPPDHKFLRRGRHGDIPIIFPNLIHKLRHSTEVCPLGGTQSKVWGETGFISIKLCIHHFLLFPRFTTRAQLFFIGEELTDSNHANLLIESCSARRILCIDTQTNRLCAALIELTERVQKQRLTQAAVAPLTTDT